MQVTRDFDAEITEATRALDVSCAKANGSPNAAAIECMCFDLAWLLDLLRQRDLLYVAEIR